MSEIADDADSADDKSAVDVFENNEMSRCWNATVIACAHIVTSPNFTPSSVDVTIASYDSVVPNGLARTVVEVPALEVEMHPTNVPAAFSSAEAAETV